MSRLREIMAPEPAPALVPVGIQNIPAWPAKESHGSTSVLIEYAGRLWRHKLLLVLTTVLCGGGAYAFSHYQTPQFRATSSLEVHGYNENLMGLSDPDPVARSRSSANDSFIPNQIEILTSNTLLERAAERLQLPERPEFQPTESRYIQVKRTLGFDIGPMPSVREAMLGTIRSQLNITIPRGSRVFKIEYDCSDPRLAADFANTLAQQFVEHNLELRLQATMYTRKWLDGQLEDMKRNLEQSEQALQGYARYSGLIFTGEKENVAEGKLKQLQDELSKAEAERINRQSRYELLKQTSAENLAQGTDGTALRDYQSKLTTLRQQFAEQRALFTPAHYKVKQIQAQIGELEAALERERKDLLQRISSDFDSARRREELLSRAYASQASFMTAQEARAIHYRTMKREVDTNRQIYESMLQKAKEANVASAMRASNIVMFDPATAPSRPYKPDILLNTALGILAGLMLGVGVVHIRESTDRRIRAPGETSSLLPVPELGIIPSARLLNGSSYARRFLGPSTQPTFMTAWSEPGSGMSESFRATLVSILANASRSPLRTLIFTSCEAGEGKSTVVANLGIGLARTGRSVLLIDADLHRPTLHDGFGLENEAGFGDFLVGKDQEIVPASFVRHTSINRLSIITAGKHDSVPENDLLHSPRLRELLTYAQDQFDIVLIDTPPVGRCADARVIGRVADAVVLVCRAGHAESDGVQFAYQQLAGDGLRVLGTILNDWEPERTRHNHYYSYYVKEG